MKVKKMLMVVLTFALIISLLLACSNQDGASENGEVADASGSESVTLRVWGDLENQSILEEPFNKINEAFMEEHPDIKIEYDFAQNLETLNVAIQSNSLPDLFWVQGNKSTTMKELAENGYIMPIEEAAFDLSRYPEESIEYAMIDDQFYCSPPSFFDYVTIFYNEDIFQEHNLDVPETWDEFVQVVEKLADSGVTPIALGGQGDFDRYWFMQALAPAKFNDVLGDIAENKESIDLDKMAAGFDIFREFSEKGYFGKDFVAVDGAGAQFAFTNGNAAMIVDGTWNNPMYEDTSLNIGRFALPNDEGVKYAQSGPSNANTYAISADTEYPEAATEYVRFLASLEAQQILQDYNGQVPILDDIEPRDEGVEELAQYDEIGYNIYHELSSVSSETSKPHDILLTDVLPKLMTSEITGEEAAARIAEELNN